MKRRFITVLAVCLLVSQFAVSAFAAETDAEADRAADRAAWRVTPDDLVPNSQYWEQNWNGDGTKGLHVEETAKGTAVYIGADKTATLGWCLARPVALDGLHLYLRDMRFESDHPVFTVTFDAEGVREVNRGEHTLRFDLDEGSLLYGDTELVPAGNTVIRSMGAGQDTQLSVKARGDNLQLTLNTPTGTVTADFAPPAFADAAYLNFSTYLTAGVLAFELMAVHGGNEPCVPMTPDYDAVRYAVDTADFNNHNWWGERLSRTDLQNGGLRVRIQSDATGHIGVLYGERVSFDGLSLNFSRVKGGGTNSNICLLLGEDPSKGFDSGKNLLLVLNFTKGTLYAYPPAGGYDIIQQNDLIRSLADGNTPFTVSVKEQRDGNYCIAVETLRDRVDGVLANEHLGKSMKDDPSSTNLYISCHGSNDLLEFDLLSLRHGDMRDFGTATRKLYDAYTNNAVHAARVREGIDRLGKITLTSGETIAALEADYAALYDAAPVTNYTSLIAARRRYEELYAAAVDGARPAQYAFKIPSVSREFNLHNARYCITDVNNGVKIECNDSANWAGRVVMEQPLTADGLRIELTGQDSLKTGALSVALLRNTEKWTDQNTIVMLLEPPVNGNNGLLRLVYCRETGQEIRAVHFERNVFSADSVAVQLCAVGDGDTYVLFVNGQRMAELSLQNDLCLAADGLCYAAFGYWSGTNGDAAVTVTDLSCSADFDRVATVEKAINGIGEVTHDSGESIDAAQTAYRALPTRLKRVVTGQAELNEAIARYEILLTGSTGSSSSTTLGEHVATTTPSASTPTAPPVTGSTASSATTGTTVSGSSAATASTSADSDTPSHGGDVSVLRIAAVSVGVLALAAVVGAAIVVAQRKKL